jgi:hypothetical protein
MCSLFRVRARDGARYVRRLLGRYRGARGTRSRKKREHKVEKIGGFGGIGLIPGMNN